MWGGSLGRRMRCRWVCLHRSCHRETCRHVGSTMSAWSSRGMRTLSGKKYSSFTCNKTTSSARILQSEMHVCFRPNSWKTWVSDFITGYNSSCKHAILNNWKGEFLRLCETTRYLRVRVARITTNKYSLWCFVCTQIHHKASITTNPHLQKNSTLHSHNTELHQPPS